MRGVTEVLSRAAGSEPVAFTGDDVRRRVAVRRRARRCVHVAAAAVVVLAGIAVIFGPFAADRVEQVQTVPSTGVDGQIVGRWRLGGLSAVTAVDRPAWLVLGPDGMLRGDTGCNAFTGRWSTEREQLEVDELVMTDVGCPEPQSTVERLVVDTLQSDPAIAPFVDDGASPPSAGGPWPTLQLTSPDGSFVFFHRYPDMTMSARTLDGREWTVTDSMDDGVCVTVGESELGCTYIGPGRSIGAGLAAPHTVVEPTGEGAGVVYGFLPMGATRVELRHDDGRLAEGTATIGNRSMWAAPIAPGATPDTVVYLDDTGTEISRHPLTP